MTIRITVLDDYQGCCASLDAAKALSERDVLLDIETRHIAAPDLVARLQNCDVVVLIRERTTLTRALLEQLPRLRLVVQTGRLSQAIDIQACEALGIAVRDGSGSPIAPAELTWLLIMAGCRRLDGYLAQQRVGRWQRTSADIDDEALGHVVAGRTLGIWGLGRIGGLVAGYARAFGMQIVAHGRGQSAARAAALDIGFEPDRQAFLARCDVLSLNLKLNAETRGLITPIDLAVLPPHSLLVNTSRAELITPGALLSALDAGRPGAAALDVFENEPDGALPYQAHPRVLATPHIGFVEKDTYELYFDTAFRQVLAFFDN